MGLGVKREGEREVIMIIGNELVSSSLFPRGNWHLLHGEGSGCLWGTSFSHFD